jgi:hypothetical protein
MPNSACCGVLCCALQGTYFLVADFAGLLPAGSTEDDVEVRGCCCCHLSPAVSVMVQQCSHLPGQTPPCVAWPRARRRLLPARRSSPAQRSSGPPACCLQFCYRLTREAGVTLIPVSAFHADRATAPRTLVRFVFCKTEQKLQTACDKLRRYFGKP